MKNKRYNKAQIMGILKQAKNGVLVYPARKAPAEYLLRAL